MATPRCGAFCVWACGLCFALLLPLIAIDCSRPASSLETSTPRMETAERVLGSPPTSVVLSPQAASDLQQLRSLLPSNTSGARELFGRIASPDQLPVAAALVADSNTSVRDFGVLLLLALDRVDEAAYYMARGFLADDASAESSGMAWTAMHNDDGRAFGLAIIGSLRLLVVHLDRMTTADAERTRKLVMDSLSIAPSQFTVDIALKRLDDSEKIYESGK